MDSTAPKHWTNIGVCVGSQPFLIDGVNVWALDWRAADVHQKAAVIDPVHGQSFSFSVYRFFVSDRQTLFAAGEFSNGVWGFYVPTTDVGRPPGGPSQSPNVTPLWQRLIPFVPLTAAVLSVPWIVLVIMANLGGPGSKNPYWKAQFLAESVAVAVVGLLVAVAGLRWAKAWGPVAWTAYGLGCLMSAAVIAGMVRFG